MIENEINDTSNKIESCQFDLFSEPNGNDPIAISLTSTNRAVCKSGINMLKGKVVHHKVGMFFVRKSYFNYMDQKKKIDIIFIIFLDKKCND